jgi:Flp pilus assembly protein TadD
VRRFQAWPWNELDYLALLILVFPFFWVPVAQIFNPVRIYNRMIEAGAWGRWEEVLQLLPAVEGQVSPDEIAFRKATALAALGRLDEGLQVVEPFQDGNGIPEWLYWGRVCSVYLMAGQPERYVPCVEKAAELAPDNSTVLLDLAIGLLRFSRDPVRARQALEQAKQHAISDVSVPFLTMTEGMLALEEGKPSRARELLEEALTAAAPLGRVNALAAAIMDQMRVYLALAHAAEGDRETALRYFRQAEPRLRAVKATDLLDRSEQALGLPS